MKAAKKHKGNKNNQANKDHISQLDNTLLVATRSNSSFLYNESNQGK